MRRFLIVIEQGEDSYGAYSPDLPGCVAVGATQKEAEANMYEAITMHVRGMQEDGVPIPESQSIAEYVALPELAGK